MPLLLSSSAWQAVKWVGDLEPSSSISANPYKNHNSRKWSLTSLSCVACSNLHHWHQFFCGLELRVVAKMQHRYSIFLFNKLKTWVANFFQEQICRINIFLKLKHLLPLQCTHTLLTFTPKQTAPATERITRLILCKYPSGTPFFLSFKYFHFSNF